MQGGHSEALAEGGSGQGQVPLQGGEVFPPPVLAFLFARQVDPRHLCHTEGLKVIVKLLCAQTLANHHKGRVTGVLHCFRQGLMAMSLNLGAVDPHPIDHIVARAIEGGVFIHHALLQGGGQHQRLEGGARLVRLPDGLVPPLGLPRLCRCLGGGLFLKLRVGLLLLRGLLGVLRLELLIKAGDVRLDLPLEQAVCHCGVAVGIELRGAGHSQDGPGLGIHHHAEAAVAHIVRLDPGLNGLLGIGLDGAVQGQGQIIAVDRVDIVGVAVAGDALEHVLIAGLQAVHAPFGVDKAQHLRGQGGKGVVPLRAGGEVKVIGGLVLLDEGPNGLGLPLLHIGQQHLILGVLLLQTPLQVRPVQVRTDGAQAVCHLVPFPLDLLLISTLVQLSILVLKVVLIHAVNQVFRGQDQVVDGGRHGHHLAVGIQDVPPVSRYRHIHQLLLGSLLLIEVVVPDGDVPQLHRQRDEKAHPAYQHQDHGAAEHHPLGDPVLFRLAVVPAFPLFPLTTHAGSSSLPVGRKISLLTSEGRREVAFPRPLSLSRSFSGSTIWPRQRKYSVSSCTIFLNP